MREECDEDPSQSDETEAEMSPPKSPSTPKNVKSKNSGTAWLPALAFFGACFIFKDHFTVSCDLLSDLKRPVKKTNGVGTSVRAGSSIRAQGSELVTYSRESGQMVA